MEEGEVDKGEKCLIGFSLSLSSFGKIIVLRGIILRWSQDKMSLHVFVLGSLGRGDCYGAELKEEKR